MYLRQYRAQNILYIECYGELSEENSVFFRVKSEFFLPEGANTLSPEERERKAKKHKNEIYEYVGDILSDSFTKATVVLKYEIHNSFEYQLTAEYGVEVGYQSIEDVMRHKHIGDQLFDKEFSNALKMIFN